MEDKEVCLWSKEDDDEGYYETSCENAFQFNNDDWQANGFIFCPYCGKKIEDKPIQDGEI